MRKPGFKNPNKKISYTEMKAMKKADIMELIQEPTMHRFGAWFLKSTLMDVLNFELRREDKN